jgi:hypothetical protein
MRYTMKSLAASRNRARNGSPSSGRLYAQRSGIEGANSEMKRYQGVGHVRVRGADRVNHMCLMKGSGTNWRRINRFIQEQKELGHRVLKQNADRDRKRGVEDHEPVRRLSENMLLLA